MISSSITAAPLPTDTEWVKTSIQLGRHLSSVDRNTIGNQPPGTYPLTPLVFSAGGMIEGETQKVLDGWKRAVEAWNWQRMWERMSFSLVRMRGRQYEME
jgi:hypothetical protein